MLDVEKRKKRKEEGRQQKRQRIKESGGVRPRKEKSTIKDSTTKEDKSSKLIERTATNQKAGNDKLPPSSSPSSVTAATDGQNNKPTTTTSTSNYKRKDGSFQPKRPMSSSSLSGHRFGRVMQKVPCRNKPRFSTLSIALPGSVLSNCQTKELKTLLVGQIARAATIYHVDEIVIFDDKLGKTESQFGRKHQHWRQHHNKHDKSLREHQEEESTTHKEKQDDNDERNRIPRSNLQEFMARVLQYCECPQYLRRQFFPMHPDLQFTGLLAPVDAPHHVRAEDRSMFREGVVLEKTSSDGCALVNCGIRSRPVTIDRKLAPGIRCTVQIDPVAYTKVGSIKGSVVSPSVPRERDGTYWGYTTRVATSINDVFDSCPFGGGYDLKIGTSERGDVSTEDKKFAIPKYEHAIIVFGGVAGIEECVDADESIKLPGAHSRKLFDMWLNICPFQGSRTIRTEEAVLICLSSISSSLSKSARSEEVVAKEGVEDVEFSDESPSDESSDESGDESGSSSE